MKRTRKCWNEPTEYISPSASPSVRDLINRALKSRAVTLDLSGKFLTELPESIGQLTQLYRLDLSDNYLKAVPESIGQLTQLRDLDLSRNELGALAESTSQLSRLQRLDLSGNLLHELPESIGRLTELQVLDLSENLLQALPASVGQLLQLQHIDLSHNGLKGLPESIGNLAQLGYLYLADNQLEALPKSFSQLTQLLQLILGPNGLKALPESVGRLTQLRHLDVIGNALRDLPESIGNLTQLRHFLMSGNQLETLPESIGALTQLQVLNLSFNRLKALPKSLQRLDSLTQLYLHRNDRLGLPPELLGPQLHEVLEHPSGVPPAKPREILEYYFRVRIKRDRRPLNEAKLILIGRGAAGKTCTVNRLVHNRFDRDEKKTEGIQITDWPVALNANENVRLNIWDFGGQEIMHATHQFFLTQRSLYLLVLSGREGGQDSDAEYWLRLIDSFGGDSPVIVVLNKIKEHPFDVNRRALQQKYPAIRAFVETDCEDGTGREDLLKAIERETDHLEHLRDAFPASWFSIKDRLAGMKDNYLTFDAYRNICAELGETDPADQEKLAFYLHSLGIVLNYKDDLRLRDTHVLNPHWVTNGIYTILNSEILEKQQGEIGLSDIHGILEASEYPVKMHRFLLDLMKKFDLCFSFPDDDTHYLIPELLDKQEPEASALFKPEECLNFEYHYPVLPEGLLPRFVVRTHILSEGQPRWRTGVILKFERNLALVKADVQDKRVFIWVSGSDPGRRRLLAVIRSDFERIHSDIRNLKPEEMVPLQDYPKEVLKYRDLSVMEKNGIKKFPKVIGSEVIQLTVDQLLNGVDLDRTHKRKRAGDDAIQPVGLFYSYSHKDENLRDQLETHLKILHRLGMIEPWYDRKITEGDEWKQKIDENLERANIILLLVSADFIASDYCYEKEMKRALERHETKEARVIPIIVRDVNWTKAPFAKLQALPKDGLAVTLWPDRDSAWRNVSEGIERVVEDLRKKA